MTAPRSIHNPVTGERYVEVVRGSATGGDYVEGRGFLPVGTRPPGVHRHPNQDELVTVVKGRICARIGKEEFEFGPGEVAVLPRGSGTTSGSSVTRRRRPSPEPPPPSASR